MFDIESLFADAARGSFLPSAGVCPRNDQPTSRPSNHPNDPGETILAPPCPLLLCQICVRSDGGCSLSTASVLADLRF
jgi:hypothetical protein